jgi:hypothetical protein
MATQQTGVAFHAGSDFRSAFRNISSGFTCEDLVLSLSWVGWREKEMMASDILQRVHRQMSLGRPSLLFGFGSRLVSIALIVSPSQF